MKLQERKAQSRKLIKNNCQFVDNLFINYYKY